MAHSENASPNANGPPAKGPSVQVHPRAALQGDGETALVTLRVTAPADADILEAFIYLVQDGQQTSFAPFHASGEGHPERITVQVSADDLTLGEASVSGYFLLSTGEAVNIMGDVHLTPFHPAAHSAAAQDWLLG